MSQGGHHKEAPLYNTTQANGWGSGLSTCKESGLFIKSMSSQNFSSFGHHFRRLAHLNSNHTTDVVQPLTLFTADQVSLLQLSNNWGREKRRDREESHSLAHNNSLLSLSLSTMSHFSLRPKVHSHTGQHDQVSSTHRMFKSGASCSWVIYCDPTSILRREEQ